MRRFLSVSPTVLLHHRVRAHSVCRHAASATHIALAPLDNLRVCPVNIGGEALGHTSVRKIIRVLFYAEWILWPAFVSDEFSDIIELEEGEGEIPCIHSHKETCMVEAKRGIHTHVETKLSKDA